MIYAYYESILVPKNNGKQNLDEYSKHEYLKHVACSYGYNLECVHDKFRKPFKSCLDEAVAYNFINTATGESKQGTDLMKKRFNKKTWDD